MEAYPGRERADLLASRVRPQALPLLARHLVLHLALLEALHGRGRRVGTVGGLKDLPADELVVDEADPEAKAESVTFCAAAIRRAWPDTPSSCVLARPLR
jgi:hypothetical protein